jgi:hypothetical protein
MNRIKLKSYLEISTRIAILLTALAVLWLILGSVLKQPKPNIHVGLRNGDLFPSVAGIDYSKNSKTLLISMSTKCASCVEGLPFFQKFREKTFGSPDSLRIIALFPESEKEVENYARERHLTLETQSGINLKALNMLGTPTIVLINNKGQIVDFWIGKLSNDIEQQISHALNIS